MSESSFTPGQLVRYPIELPTMEFPVADSEGKALKANGKLYVWNSVVSGQIGLYINQDKFFSNHHIVLFS